MYPMKKNSMLVLSLLIVCVAALFRITNLDVIEFKSDEALNLFLASRPLFDHSFAPGGIVSSIGILNPPLFNYILFPLVSISTDPRFITFCIGFINSIAIGLFFLILTKYYSKFVALSASLLFALSPWAILFSRKIWQQDLIIPLFIPFFLSLHKICIDKNPSYWILYTFSALLLIQIHQINIIFIILLTPFIIFSRKGFPLKYIAIGSLLGALPLFPFLLYQFSSCNDCNTFTQISNRLSTSHSLLLFMRPMQILAQGNFQFILGDDMLTLSQMYPLIFKLRAIFYSEYIFLLIGIFAYWKTVKKLRGVLIPTIAVPFIYFVLRIEPLMHYYIIILPLLFLFVAFGLWYLYNSSFRLLKVISVIAIFSLLLESLLFNYSFFTLLNKQLMLKGDYGSSFAIEQELINQKMSPYKNDPAYKEMVIANYLPKELMYGTLPISRMLYDFNSIKQNIPNFEERLHRVPIDDRITIQLLAYYSRHAPNKKRVNILKKKSKSIPEYQEIYQLIYSQYLSQHLRKSYANLEFGLHFEYPQHWQLQQSTPQVVKLSVDNFVIIIEKITLPQQITNSSSCNEEDNMWCGVTFPVSNIGNNSYLVRYDSLTRIPSNSSKLKEMIDTFETIRKTLQAE